MAALFVTGGPKTATSSMVGLLNSHPDVFILYEADLCRSRLSRRGQEFLLHYPDARPLFGQTEEHSLAYAQLQTWLGCRGHKYAYVGDKLPTLSLWLLKSYGQSNVIYMVRDIRSWLVKPNVRTRFWPEHDVLPIAIWYTAHLLHSFTLPRVLHVRMESFMDDSKNVVDRLEQFLGIDFDTAQQPWWDSYGRYPEGSPKGAIKWWETRESSKLSPQGADTHTRMRSGTRLEPVLDIFFQYYERLNQPVPLRDVQAALDRLASLVEYDRPLPLHDVFYDIESVDLAREAKGRLRASVGTRARRLGQVLLGFR